MSPAAVDVLEPRRQGGVEDVARLGEGGEAVGVEHLRPQIGVVPGGIAAAGEQMLEMRRAVAQPDLARHADARQEFALELVGIDVGGVRRRHGRRDRAAREAVYSTVAKPWLKLRAASSRRISSSGIGSPVS